MQMGLPSTPDLSELKRLSRLEFFLSERPCDAVGSMLHMIRILSTAVPETLHSLTITFTYSLTGPYLKHSRVDPRLAQQLEDVILKLANVLRVTVSIPHAKRNRLWFWSEMIGRCFPRLHEHHILQVECASGEYNRCTRLVLRLMRLE